MWTFPVHQEQREMAAMQLGKEHFIFYLKSFLSIFLPFLPRLLLHYHFSKNVSPYVLLFNLLILLSSESENGNTGTCHRSALWNTLETSIYSNTRCSGNDSLLLPVATLHYSFLFFFPPHLALYMQICFFPASKSAFYLRTSQFLWLHCTTSTECMMIA